MPGFRAERIAEMIHRELAVRLRQDVSDPELLEISITSVEVTRDLRQATIRYTPLGGGETKPGLAKAVNRVARTLRGPIGRALRLRHAPELSFVADTRIDKAFEVMQLIDRLSAESMSSDEV